MAADADAARPTRPSATTIAACLFWLALGALAQWAPKSAERVQYSKVLGILALTLLLPVLAVIGRIALRRLRVVSATFVEEFTASAALGLGIASYFVFALAALHALQPMVIACSIAVVTGAFGADALAWSQDAGRRAWQVLRSVRRDSVASVAAVAVCSAGLIALAGALAPATDSDTLRYHFAVPAQYLRHGGFVGMPTNLFSNYPFAVEMLFTIGLALRLQIMAKLFTFGLWALTGVVVWDITRQSGSSQAAWVSLAVWATIPLGIILCSTGTVELGLALFGMLALQAVVNWRSRGDAGWLAAAAVFAGLALGTKYGAATSLMVLVLLLLADGAIQGRRGLFLAVRGAVLVFASLVLLAPWLVKNATLVGNPVFPFAGEVFHSAAWPVESTRLYLEHVRGLAPPVRWPQDLVTLAYDLAFEPRQLGGQAGAGVVFLFVCPLVAWLRPRGRASGLIVAYSLVSFIAWAATGPIVRFLLPALAPGSVLVGYAFDGLRRFRHGAVPATAGMAALLAANLFSSVMLQNAHFSPYRVVIGAEDVEYYLSRMVTYYPAARFANSELPPDAKLLLVGETRTLYLEREAVADTGFNPTVIVQIAEQARSPLEIAQELRRRGFTHLLVDWAEMVGLDEQFGYWKMTQGAQERMSQFIREDLRPVFAANDVQVLEIVTDVRGGASDGDARDRTDGADARADAGAP